MINLVKSLHKYAFFFHKGTIKPKKHKTSEGHTGHVLVCGAAQNAAQEAKQANTFSCAPDAQSKIVTE